jgi:VWFA-related protein
VLDKKGHTVTSGLTKDDFTITEDKVPQIIFSFEAPELHVMGVGGEDDNATGNAPTTILVMDLLNSSFEDFAYIRFEAAQFLKSQPPQLPSPTELLVIGNESLEMLQSFTRSRAELLDALKRTPVALPYKHMYPVSFAAERFGQSLDALDEIALQNKGVPGRKNIVWVGHGSPNLDTINLAPKFLERLKQYVHSTTNMMVDARISLFVIYPGLPVNGPPMTLSAMQAGVDLNEDDPFAGDINFGLFANETGGKLFYNRNNLDAEIKESEQIGSQYYTLTYQPQPTEPDGEFRRVRVNVRNPNLRAVTKAGYYAPDAHAPIDERHQQMIKLAEAVQSNIPFKSLDLMLSGVVYHPDTQTVEFTVELKSKNLMFESSEDGRIVAQLMATAASLNQYGDILASRTHTVTLVAHSLDPAKLPDVASRFPFAVRVPRKTRRVRLILQAVDGGRLGSAEIDQNAIDAAPAMDTPRPELKHRPGADDRSPPSSN